MSHPATPAPTQANDHAADGQVPTLITKDQAGAVKTRPVLPVHFTLLHRGERI